MLHLHNILNGYWLMNKSYATNYLPLIANYLKGERLDISQLKVPELNDRNSICIHSGSDNSKRVSINDAPKGAIAIINIEGAITKYDQECGPAGMKTKADLLKQCYASDNISSVILKIDSGGGEGYAMQLMQETISERNKPVGAFIDDFACSAAYGIASACDYICANSNMARIGSIGAYITIIDLSKQFEMLGINIIEMYSSFSTDKNKDHNDAVAGKPEALIADLDVFTKNFLDSVEKNRNGKLKGDRTEWGTGKVWYAEQALELGLIDGIDTFENFINYFNS
jgi:ClpP class serine protease